MAERGGQTGSAGRSGGAGGGGRSGGTIVGDRRTGRPVLPETVAIRRCEAITRREAKNFWYGIRVLPAVKRRALAVVYAVARRIDDIGDGDVGAADRAAALDELCAALLAPDAASRDPVVAALAQVTTVCPLPLDAFESLVRGVRMDVDGVTYGTIDELVPYCRRVAGSVGRLSLAVFMIGEHRDAAPAAGLADDLGVALQLTNILRDVREDLAMGRVYLPAADLERFGLTTAGLGRPSPEGAALVRYEAARAEEWYARGMRLLPLLDRRSAACVGAMAGIYRRLLGHIERRPEEVFRRRLSLPAGEKLAVTLRALAGAGV